MRALKIGIAALALAAGGVFAAPVVWTVPTTSIGTNTISGTFTYDRASNTLSAIHITSAGTNPGSFTIVNNLNLPAPIRIGQITATASIGDLIFFFDASALPTTGAAPTITTVGLAICGAVLAGLCSDISSSVGIAEPLLTSVTAVASTAVPTLSECALIALASLMAMGGIWALRKRARI